MSSPDARAVDLRRVRDRLARIQDARAAQRFADEGKTPREIADLLHTTEPRVRRMLKATEGRDVDYSSPEEIILRATLDGTPRDALVQRLAGMAYTFRQHAPDPFEGAASGTWDEVRHAHATGLLTHEEFERVRAAVQPTGEPSGEHVRRADQVARDMALESQTLTSEAYARVLQRLVDLRVGAEPSDP